MSADRLVSPQQAVALRGPLVSACAVAPEAKRRRVRLADVARAAGVSVSTASRALNGYAEITEATRERIEHAAMKLGYRAHSTARSLRLGDVGMAVAVVDAESLHPGPDRVSYFWSRMLTELTIGLSVDHLALVTVMQDEAPQLLGTLPYDVALVLSTRNDLSHVLAALPFGVPVVTAVSPDVPARSHVSLGHDYAGAAQEVLDHLASVGATRSAVLLPPIDHSHTDQFANGALAWFAEHGSEEAGTVRKDAPERFAEAVAELVAEGFDGLFCLLADGEDTYAALRAAGAEPGRDVHVVVLSDAPVEALLDPPATTLELLPDSAAEGVMAAARKVLQGGSGTVVLPHRLVVRDS